MSIDKTTMKIFFEAMEGTMVGNGYSSKIVSTPMGPFRWNDTVELWENVNNGMMMNNISFQDMMIMGYETSSGDNGTITTGPDVTPILTNSFGNLTGITTGAVVRWSSVSGPQTNLINGSTVAFSDITTPITLRLSVVVVQGTGNALTNYYYSIDGANGITYTPAGFTIGNNQILRLAVKTPNDIGSAEGATGTLFLTNFSAGGNTLASITWSYQYPLS